MKVDQLVGNNSITLNLIGEQRVNDGYVYTWKVDIFQVRGRSLDTIARQRARVRSLGEAGLGKTVRTRAGNNRLMNRLTMLQKEETTASFDYTKEVVYTIKVITG